MKRISLFFIIFSATVFYNPIKAMEPSEGLAEDLPKEDIVDKERSEWNDYIKELKQHLPTIPAQDIKDAKRMLYDLKLQYILDPKEEKTAFLKEDTELKELQITWLTHEINKELSKTTTATTVDEIYKSIQQLQKLLKSIDLSRNDEAKTFIDQIKIDGKTSDEFLQQELTRIFKTATETHTRREEKKKMLDSLQTSKNQHETINQLFFPKTEKLLNDYTLLLNEDFKNINTQAMEPETAIKNALWESFFKPKLEALNLDNPSKESSAGKTIMEFEKKQQKAMEIIENWKRRYGTSFEPIEPIARAYVNQHIEAAKNSDIIRYAQQIVVNLGQQLKEIWPAITKATQQALLALVSIQARYIRNEPDDKKLVWDNYQLANTKVEAKNELTQSAENLKIILEKISPFILEYDDVIAPYFDIKFMFWYDVIWHFRKSLLEWKSILDNERILAYRLNSDINFSERTITPTLKKSILDEKIPTMRQEIEKQLGNSGIGQLIKQTDNETFSSRPGTPKEMEESIFLIKRAYEGMLKMLYRFEQVLKRPLFGARPWHFKIVQPRSSNF